LLDVGNEDLWLRTVPHLGATLNFDMYNLPNSAAYLLQSLAELHPPLVFPGVGTLYIRRNTMQFIPIGSTNGSGFVTGTFNLPTSSSFLGTSFYFQGFVTQPRHLTNDWIKVTILP